MSISNAFNISNASNTSNAIVNCPHCGCDIEIESVNCGIFRCGVYMHNNQQLDPHLSEIECKKLVSITDKKDINHGINPNVNYLLIWGCARPFKIIIENNKYKTEKCEYL